jgi:hypothetical protein
MSRFSVILPVEVYENNRHGAFAPDAGSRKRYHCRLS